MLSVAASLADVQPWRKLAACSDPALGDEDERLALFFDEARQAEALAVCAGCAVRAECAEWATLNSEVGTWGGTLDAQRLRRRVDAHTEEAGWLAACQRCGGPFVAARTRGIPPAYCAGCRVSVRSETVRRSREKRRRGATLPIPGLIIPMPVAAGPTALAADGRRQ